MSKYDKLKKTNIEQNTLEKQKFELAVKEINEIITDAERTSSVYQNAESHLNNIDESFEIATGLNKTDVTILMLATALQISRWVVIGIINGNVTQKISESRVKHNDNSIKEMEKEKHSDYLKKHKEDQHIKTEHHRDWLNIVTDSVPYDITKGSKKFNINLEGGYHRIHTLGHDPILGWFVGPVNILSDTITLNDWQTFKICMDEHNKHFKGFTSFPNAFFDAIDSIKEDSKRLPAAIFAQAVHYKSDKWTKLGLPVPVLETFAPEFASKLYKDGYDSLCLTKDIAVVGVQMALSILINLIITLIHGLYYDSNSDLTQELYEVKTRKILVWSNVIASSSNVLAVTGTEIAAFFTQNPELAKVGGQFVDLGGYIVTMYRLIKDIKFIRNVKQDFLEHEWEKLVIGEDFNFIGENNGQ